MARRGSFGGGLNPFGTGSLSNLGQYDIGQNLADLAIYEVGVRWGNGTATDAEYLAALQKGIDATDAGTHARVAAQNKMDDALYTIGRSKADTAGLDALVAFDQASLAKMNPANNRYRDVEQSLNSELAQRRSRDYGRLVDDYNLGKSTTKTLHDWVAKTVKGLDPNAPDFENWKDTLVTLDERVRSEKDAQVYQDYQDHKMAAPAFLAYITTRRDGYGQSSPQYADWQRRLDDASRQVKNTELAAKDQAFFDAYEEGKRTDKQYLGYIRARIADMDANDPDLEQWKHRYHQAAFSTAEDQLRFDVQRGKRKVGELIAFYKNYRSQMNPGSAEYRTLTRAILSLAGASSGTASAGGRRGGGGGTTSSASATTGGGPTVKGGTGIPGDLGKVIDTNRRVSFALSLMAVMPAGLPQYNVHWTKAQKAAYSKLKKQQQASYEMLLLNIDTLAIARGTTDTWQFSDPRHLGKEVTLPVSDDTYAALLGLKANYNYALAGIAIHNHDPYHYGVAMMDANGATDKARSVAASVVIKNDVAWYQQTQDGIEQADRIADYATELNLATSMAQRLYKDLANPSLDDATRAKLEKMADKLGANPLLPTSDPVTGQITSPGAISQSSIPKAGSPYTNVQLGPGWHHVIGPVKADGTSTWGPEFDTLPLGQWDQKHVKVRISYGGRLVTGEAELGAAPTNSSAFFETTNAGQVVFAWPDVRYVQYADEHGQKVNLYSLDGVTWIKSESGSVPQLMGTEKLTKYTDPHSGHTEYRNGKGTVLFVQDLGDDAPKPTADMKDPANAGAVDWWGGAAGRAQSELDAQKMPTWLRQLQRRSGDTMTPEEWNAALAAKELSMGRAEVGGSGQYMSVYTMGPDGSLSLLPAPDHRRAALDVREHQRVLGNAPTRAQKGKEHAAQTDVDFMLKPRSASDHQAHLIGQLPVGTPAPRYGTGLGPPTLPPSEVQRPVPAPKANPRLPLAEIKKPALPPVKAPTLAPVKAVAPAALRPAAQPTGIRRPHKAPAPPPPKPKGIRRPHKAPAPAPKPVARPTTTLGGR